MIVDVKFWDSGVEKSDKRTTNDGGRRSSYNAEFGVLPKQYRKAFTKPVHENSGDVDVVDPEDLHSIRYSVQRPYHVNRHNPSDTRTVSRIDVGAELLAGYLRQDDIPSL